MDDFDCIELGSTMNPRIFYRETLNGVIVHVPNQIFDSRSLHEFARKLLVLADELDRDNKG